LFEVWTNDKPPIFK